MGRFRLSKRNGKKCCMLCARGLGIAWGDNPNYWHWTLLPESRFSEAAELRNVCWLSIVGVIRAIMLYPETIYASYLVFKLSENHDGLDCQSNAMVKFIEKGNTTKIVGAINEIVYIVGAEDGRVPDDRRDGGMEIELGTIFNCEEHKNADVHMQISKTADLWWKSGLIFEGIEVRPMEPL